MMGFKEWMNHAAEQQKHNESKISTHSKSIRAIQSEGNKPKPEFCSPLKKIPV
jgi:hypothetical protein